MSQRRILVTAALPYANGHIHIGHLVEYIQTDIWVRFQNMQKNRRCIYICADDTHGTAIMLRARQEGRSEKELIADMQQAHERDFAAFDIEFDHYGSTNSAENRELCAEIWKAMREAGRVKEKEIEQLYDPESGTFLADRFVRGTCPHCKTPDQPGDNCSKCGRHYSPADLIDPKSTLSGATPELRTAKHLFIELEQLHDFLEEWSQTGDRLQSEVANYLKGHFLHEPLRDWDISRPSPYFGFEIPDSPGNYWYVWFDAPIGYMASTKQWCEKNDEAFDEWWPRGNDEENRGAEIHHFIGKDITYFHTLFWPGMLRTAEFKRPKKVHIHGFLTVAGKKMSKSDGTFVLASTYLKHLDPSYLRYYYASKLGPRLDDLDLNLKEFKQKIDSDLVGKVVNIASRCAKFVAEKNLSPSFPGNIGDDAIHWEFKSQAENIANLYHRCDYNAAMRQIMLLADSANQWIENHRPWELAKQSDDAERLRDVCTVGLSLFRQLTIYLAPVLPGLARQAEKLLNITIHNWEDAQQPLVGVRVNNFEHMMKRVDPKKVQAMIEESKEAEVAVSPSIRKDSPEALAKEPLAGEQCSFDDFMKVDMRVARVVEAEEVQESNKLLRLTLSLGGDEQRQVLAGIKGVYKPEELLGQLVICCVNLAPRKMRFGVSEGMVLAAGPGGEDIFVLRPDSGAVPGQRVH